jgi:hypothetical protein
MGSERCASRLVHMLIGASLLMGCDQVTVTTGDTIPSSEVEDFFRKHKVDGNRAVAMRKRSLGGVAYLATIHGYPDNLSVCEEVIAPYNKDASLSDIPGQYFCEELR